MYIIHTYKIFKILVILQIICSVIFIMSLPATINYLFYYLFIIYHKYNICINASTLYTYVEYVGNSHMYNFQKI